MLIYSITPTPLRSGSLSPQNWYADTVNASGIERIRIHPWPLWTSASGLEINYVGTPTQLTAFSSINEILDRYSQSVIYYTTAHCWAMWPSSVNFNTYMSLYYSSLGLDREEEKDRWQIQEQYLPPKQKRD